MLETKKVIRAALAGVAPGMKFSLSFENEKFKGRPGTAQRVVVAYNADVADERGLSEKDMRSAVKEAFPADSFLRTVQFEKTYFPKVRINQDEVDAIVDALQEGKSTVEVLDLLSRSLGERKSKDFLRVVLSSADSAGLV